ncbi:hypothetical protein PCASD_17888, partial [Puccinia coronata f. sp. avenae]
SWYDDDDPDYMDSREAPPASSPSASPTVWGWISAALAARKGMSTLYHSYVTQGPITDCPSEPGWISCDGRILSTSGPCSVEPIPPYHHEK